MHTCPKCEQPMEAHQCTFWLPRHAPNQNPPISNTDGEQIRAYACTGCGYIELYRA